MEKWFGNACGNSFLVKKSLSYWNMRPFTYWVDALPGWYESIRAKAELVQDSFFGK